MGQTRLVSDVRAEHVADAGWAEEVRELARRRDAVLLAHNYQLPAIQDVADHTGDSLALSRIAAASEASTIVFCGVHFMAETAKILSPDKTVLIPDARAGCSLADSITADQLREWKARAPRRRRRLLRQHDGRGQGGDRHLLHLVQRRRGRRVGPGRPGGPVPARPVPRRARPPHHRPGEHARLGGGVPRPRRDQRSGARRAGRRAPRRRALRPPRVRLRHLGPLPRRRRRRARRTGPDPLDRRDARRGPCAHRPARCSSPPRSGCCTSSAGPRPRSTSGP